MLRTWLRTWPTSWSAVTSMRICVVWSDVAPCRMNENAPFAVAQSASVAAMGAGSVVVQDARRVGEERHRHQAHVGSGPVPVFSTVKPTVAVSQLSRKASPSPPDSVSR